MLQVVVPVDRSALHAVQSALEDLPGSFRYVSTSHSLQNVSPLPSWYWPAGQAAHFPLEMPYVPKSHPLHVAAPSIVVVSPSLHCWHCVASMSFPFRANPNGQLLQPSPYVPAPHAAHLTLPSSDDQPTGQSRHVGLPTLF